MRPNGVVDGGGSKGVNVDGGEMLAWWCGVHSTSLPFGVSTEFVGVVALLDCRVVLL